MTDFYLAHRCSHVEGTVSPSIHSSVCLCVCVCLCLNNSKATAKMHKECQDLWEIKSNLITTSMK